MKIGEEVGSYCLVTLNPEKEKELIEKENKGKLDAIESWQLKSFKHGSLRLTLSPYMVFNYELHKEQYDELGEFVNQFV